MLGSRESRVVLVIDDDPDIRSAIEVVLGDEGYDVRSFGNGLEALKYLRTSEPPCIVLLDLMMPVMNGWQLVQALGEEGIARIPLVIVSAAPPTPDIAGLPFLQKPISLDRLLGVVESFCGRGGA